MPTIDEVKTFTGGLNRDDDARYLPQGDYIDALNLTSNTSEGSGGVLVGATGNDLISVTTPTGTNPSTNPYTFRRAFDADTNVALFSDTIHIFSHQWSTGDAVVYDENSGTTLTPLVDATTYYVIRVDANNIKLATTEVNANLGTAIDISAKAASSEVQYIKAAAANLPPSTNRVIGAVDDRLNGYTYYFIYNDTGAHSIYRYEYENNFSRVILQEFQYDQEWSFWNDELSGEWASGVFNLVGDTVWYNDKYYTCYSNTLSPHTTEPIVDWHSWTPAGEYLNFNEDYLITHANVIEHNGNDFLTWTDNLNEPSKINVTRLLASDKEESYPPMVREYVDAYAYSPQLPLKPSYGNSGLESNNVREALWQFKYRWIYRDGEVSAFSPISKVAIPTVDVYIDRQLQVDSQITMKVFTRDDYNDGYDGTKIYRSMVKKVEVYAKRVGDRNTGSFYLYGTFDADEDSIATNSPTYSDIYRAYYDWEFRNEKVPLPIDSAESNLFYDFMPPKAATQSIIGNRIVYGNGPDFYEIGRTNMPSITAAGSYVSSFTSTNPPAIGFKNGCNHIFSVSYSDGKGRTSNVIEESEASVYLEYADSANVAHVAVELNLSGNPPDWAEFYHINWAGNQTKSNWICTGGNPISVSGSNIATATLVTIDDFQDEYGENSSSTASNLYYGYTLTKGDIIVPIYDASSSAYWKDAHSQVDSAVIQTVSGFDITFDVTNWAAPPANGDVFEIYSPKKSSSDGLWYEIGASFKVYTDSSGNKRHGGSSADFVFNRDETSGQTARVKLNAGDAYSFDIAQYTGGTISGGITVYEHPYMSPIYTSKSSSGSGRPNSVSKTSGANALLGTVFYSEKYIENTDFFGISRFYAENIKDVVNPSFGGIMAMSPRGNDLLLIQEDRTSIAGINKYYIYSGDLTSTSIGQTEEFITEASYFPLEYGTQNPESLSSFGGVRYWVDAKRAAVMRLEGGSISRISDVKMSTFFDEKLTYPFKYNTYSGSNSGNIYGVYNMRDSEYIVNMDSFDIITRPIAFDSGSSYVITFTQADADLGTVSSLTNLGVVPLRFSGTIGSWSAKTITASTSTTITVTISSLFPAETNIQIYVPKIETIAWNDSMGRWSSRYSFNPEYMVACGDGFASFSGGEFYNHITNLYSDGSNYYENWCRYYGTVYDCEVRLSANQNPIKIKQPLGLNVESNQAWGLKLGTNEREQLTSLETTDFELLEGQYWAAILRDSNTPNIAYPLLDGDEIRGSYFDFTIDTSISEGVQPKIFSVTVPQLYIPIS